MSEETPSWKVSDLVGFSVVTETGEVLGALMDVLPTGANDVFVVSQGEQETLIPALKTVVIDISMEQKKIVVRLPKGLREIYTEPLKSS